MRAEWNYNKLRVKNKLDSEPICIALEGFEKILQSGELVFQSYGGYAGGGRTGDGIIFMDGGDYCYLFTDAWSNDAPNGNGAVKWVYLVFRWKY